MANTYSGFDLSLLNTPTKVPMAIGELMEKAFLNTDQNKLNQLVTWVPNVQFDTQVGIIDPDLGLFMGAAVQACGDQVAQKINANVNPKTYAPKRTQVEIKICEDDFLRTLGEYVLDPKNPSEITNTQLINTFMYYLELNYWKEMERLIFMNDLDAALTTDSPSGHISPSVTTAGLEFFNRWDGVFKQFETIIAATPARRTTLTGDPNAQTTYADQLSVLTAANATRSLKDLWLGAKPVLRQQNDIVKLCTESIGLKHYDNMTSIAVGVPQSYDNLQNGLSELKVDGKPFIVDPVLDEFIDNYFNDGTKWYDPHRAAMYSKKNVQVAFPGANLAPVPKIWYDFKTKFVYIRMEFAMDVVVVDENLIQYGV